MCAAVALALVQFSTPHIVELDGFYHIKLASLMRTEGLMSHFPWLPLTILNANDFVDHHFLFHLMQIPFTFGDLTLGAKLASTFFAALAVVAIWWLFKAMSVPYAPILTLGFFALSEDFLFRMSMPRVQSLSLAALVLGMYFLLAQRQIALAALSALYVWLFDGFPLIVVLAACYVAAVWMVDRNVKLRTVVFALGGVAAGLLVNPYFPKNLIFIYRHVVPKVFSPAEISVGSEWFPYNTTQLLENSGPAMILLAVSFVLIALTRKGTSVPTVFSLLLVFVFAAMLFQSRRFIEYFPAFVLILFAFSFMDWGGKGNARKIKTRSKAIAAIVLLITGVQTLTAAATSVRASSGAYRYESAAQYLARNTPAATRVFHTDWDDFPPLFFYNHHNTYIVGLDPTYMQIADEELYNLWVAVTRGKISYPSGVITNVFESHYVLTDREHTSFIQQATEDAAMRVIYEDDFALVYEIAIGGNELMQ